MRQRRTLCVMPRVVLIRINRSAPDMCSVDTGGKHMRAALLVAVFLCLAAPASAQDSAGIARGRYYAVRACGDCHAVTVDQTQSANPAAPTFAAVANTPGMTPMALNVWLHTSHPTMPNLIIEPDRVADLIAYIGSLKKKPN